jgi:cyclophilin family peptidyl-prolyl cis-trans isomerase
MKIGILKRGKCALLSTPLAGEAADGVISRASRTRGFRNSLGVVGRRFGSIVAVVVALLHLTSGALASQYVKLDYNLTLGSRSRDTVFIELFDDRPLTQANFMQYVNADLYDGTFMHRLAEDFVIQGGGYYPVFVDEPPPVFVSLDPNAEVDLDGNPNTPNPSVVNEYSNSPTRSNLRGTIAMARIGGMPNSATNEWFVNLNDNIFLNGVDGGFTVFAEVRGDGMTLFDAFNAGPPIYITNLNPDVDNNGTRDGGPFFNYNANPPGSDGVPYLDGAQSDLLIVLEDAERIDYLGAGITTNVPAGGLIVSSRDAFIDTGTIFTGSGSLIVGAGRTLGIREGFALNRPLMNLGSLAPGLQLGSIEVQSFRQDPGASLEIQLRGTTADTQHDRVVVTDGALLGGDLDVSLISGFVPAAGNSFTILTANVIADSFDNLRLPLLGPGLVWDFTQTATAISLSVAAADYNRNGVVDTADYVLWRKTFGQTGTGLQADGNLNGQVDNGDFTVWRNNFGNISGGTLSLGAGAAAGTLAGSSAPEPSSSILVLIAGMIAATSRARRPLACRPLKTA